MHCDLLTADTNIHISVVIYHCLIEPMQLLQKTLKYFQCFVCNVKLLLIINIGTLNYLILIYKYTCNKFEPLYKMEILFCRIVGRFYLQSNVILHFILVTMRATLVC
ncbi:hypothetical protein PUN28_006559 [Cardiocondyla obscurior]|uniref:Uncharacterized protein n=1 Tax=Cardiocondyla obscurior TaxID=286306 RepID=A0AAW2GC31_9HYME